ncbi:oligopeptide transport system permease protein [Weissella uvarum]|uniref:ABC transporter permease n=1 Tax=Weissella uvarum TaxID=1479233 RepID=UPI00195FB81F|nr:ABC transporter permease [Weissella uvarum]MBM7617681.1 oligopeptide transport system permease protein [Weissella uvarum]MCM0596030.1 ABC transporter permease [Weissella uvarum]
MAELNQATPADFTLLPNDRKRNNETIEKPSLSFMQDAWRRLKKNKGAFISLWIVVIIALAAFLTVPYANPTTTSKQDVNQQNLPAKVPGNIPGLNGMQKVDGQRFDAYKKAHVKQGEYHVFGTDQFGRDIFKRVLYGTRISLEVALIAAMIDLVFGVSYGLISGWKGGRVDMIMQRIVEIVSSVPNLVIFVLLILILKPGLFSIALGISLTSWTSMARLVRAEVLSLKEQDFVSAARTLGTSPVKIGLRHLVPNISSTIIVQLMFTIPSAIFFEALLSFIGIGIPVPMASLGTLLNDGQAAFQFYPYQLVFPAIVMSVLMIAFNLLADGLRDAFDPRTRD